MSQTAKSQITENSENDISPKSTNLATDTSTNQSQIKDFSKENSLDNDMLTLDHFTLIGSQDEVYPIKVHKYKEIKHYIKGEVLGRGKFGTVREFIDKKTLKRFAGKIIRRYILRKDPHLRRQVNKELAITYHFDHRNIMRVYDLFATTAKIYMFMEFCYGELSEFLSVYRCLPKCQAKDYFTQTLDGLDYLHSRRVIHRDIKPENILISHNNTIKLADFGVCQETCFFSSNDTVCGNDGTPLYHPPELFDPKIMEYSGSKIDIWAAGVILYRMLTGQFPFFNNPITTKDDIDDILTKNVQYTAEVKADILLQDLLNRIFEKKYKKRISISEIRKNPWMQMDLNSAKTEPYLPFPTENRNIDCYRGLTVLTRIHDKYYPPPDSKSQLVNFKTSEESRQMRPLLRSTRMIQTSRKIIPDMMKEQKSIFI